MWKWKNCIHTYAIASKALQAGLPLESITGVAVHMQLGAMYMVMLMRCCMQGRPLSLSLFSSYLLSSIIDCSLCANFICWQWIMNETRSGGAFSFPLVRHPISHLQCIWAIRDQARGSQHAPPRKGCSASGDIKGKSLWWALCKTRRQASLMTKQEACAQVTSMSF